MEVRMGMTFQEWKGMGMSLFPKIPNFLVDVFRITEQLTFLHNDLD